MNRTDLTDKELEGYLEARNFAKGAGKEIVSRIKTGMNEKEIEDIAYDVFRTSGIKQHWHMPVIGVGKGSTKLKDMYTLMSSYMTKHTRTLLENDIVLIDIAPVYNGYPADYTISHVTGSNPDLEALAAYAHDVSYMIAGQVNQGMVVADVFQHAKELIKAKPEYTLALPPLISMGHRLCRIPPLWQRFPEPGLTYLLLRGRSFISSGNSAQMSRLWVIEPYLMYKERAAKFEVLVHVGEETMILD